MSKQTTTPVKKAGRTPRTTKSSTPESKATAVTPRAKKTPVAPKRPLGTPPEQRESAADLRAKLTVVTAANDAAIERIKTLETDHKSLETDYNLAVQNLENYKQLAREIERTRVGRFVLHRAKKQVMWAGWR